MGILVNSEEPDEIPQNADCNLGFKPQKEYFGKQ